NPHLKIGFVGARVAVDLAGSLKASAAIDFVCGNEFDFTVKDVANGLPLSKIAGLTFRGPSGSLTFNSPRPMIQHLDEIPLVTEVYKRDLCIENYFIGYLRHPYIFSLYRPRLPIEMHVLFSGPRPSEVTATASAHALTFLPCLSRLAPDRFRDGRTRPGPRIHKIAEAPFHRDESHGLHRRHSPSSSRRGGNVPVRRWSQVLLSGLEPGYLALRSMDGTARVSIRSGPL